MHGDSNEHEGERPVEREPLSIDATGGDWLKPPVRLGDDGALYVRDPDAVSGTRRIEPGTPERAMRATLHTDGAARHKLSEPTGPAGIGAVLRSESGEIIGQIAKGIGPATNNVAEYTALIEGLQMALDAGVTDIGAYIDSPVVAGHLLKGHRVKADHLRPLVERVRQLLDLFSTSSLARVPRALNADADKLAKLGANASQARAASDEAEL